MGAPDQSSRSRDSDVSVNKFPTRRFDWPSIAQRCLHSHVLVTLHSHSTATESLVHIRTCTRNQLLSHTGVTLPYFLLPSVWMSHRGHPSPANGNAHRPTPLTGASSPSHPLSRNHSRVSSLDFKQNGTQHGTSSQLPLPDPDDDFSDWDAEEEDEGMDSRHPPLHRQHTDGRSHQPLLQSKDGEERERGRSGYNSPSHPPPFLSRRSTLRSRSPDTQAKLATRKKYTYAAFFLGLSLVSFVVQTETAVYIQHELGWNKAYCML